MACKSYSQRGIAKDNRVLFKTGMNILILGGAGFLGNNVVRRFLVPQKHTVTVVDSLESRLHTRLSTLSPVRSKITFIKGDLRDGKLMRKVVKKQDVIINCAAQTSHPLSLKDPLFDVELNCRGNITLL